MLLSILIPSLESRKQQLETLLDSLVWQLSNNGFAVESLTSNSVSGFLATAGETQVEVLTYVDNKELTTGKKRQWLLEFAEGEYIVFIDDDDEIYPCYLSEMIAGCNSGADCLGINGIITTNGKELIKWYLSKDNENKTVVRGGKKVYLRHTNHITAVKRSIALKAGFPDKSNAEDKAYSDALSGLLHSEFTVIPPLYHYKFSTFNKEYK